MPRDWRKSVWCWLYTTSNEASVVQFVMCSHDSPSWHLQCSYRRSSTHSSFMHITWNLWKSRTASRLVFFLMPHTYPKEYKKNLSLISIPDDGLDPDPPTHSDPYFPTCPINDLQNELEDSLDDLDLDDLDPSGVAVHNGHSIPHGGSSPADLPTLIISSSTESYDQVEPDSPHSNIERPNRVRFRSRVRITSGLNHYRHRSQQHQHQPGADHLSLSPAPSVSGSPSSSISAPLRTHTDEQVGKPGWGTLGQRVSLFAMERKRVREQRKQLRLGASSLRKGIERASVIPYVGTNEMGEETPLLLSPPSNADSTREDQAMSRVWPGGLVNHHLGFILSLHSIH